MRSGNRDLFETRVVAIKAGINPYAAGSAEVSFGGTKVLVTATVSEECPPWLRGTSRGWVTAEYGMLPSATHQRNRREAVAGKQTGRTVEIQRLIGRSLRAAIDLTDIKDISINIDCDVIVADGGTRSAAICGGWVALAMALDSIVDKSIRIKPVAALSAGIVNKQILVDLDYDEDSKAEFDCNLVLTGAREIIEVQGTAEGSPLPMKQLVELYEGCKSGFDKIFKIQQQEVSSLKNIQIEI